MYAPERGGVFRPGASVLPRTRSRLACTPLGRSDGSGVLVARAMQ